MAVRDAIFYLFKVQTMQIYFISVLMPSPLKFASFAGHTSRILMVMDDTLLDPRIVCQSAGVLELKLPA
jgi:hypothetical protein